jgi:glutamate-1-semialdehyde 2,1-aminomutase
VAAVITEPVLQNIGVVRPQAGYLEGLRQLADELGFLLIFDEIKTGFRHALGGYSAISAVKPDLVLYGKAVANGFPLALMGGKSRFMDYIAHDDPAKRPFVAGTYNGHPVCVAAAVSTIKYLIENKDTIYKNVDALGQKLEEGISKIFHGRGITAVVSRQGSAFSYYLMKSIPRDYHDILGNHDGAKDVALRRALINRGVFFVPIATKQCSLSCSHSADDVDFTLEQFASAVAEVWP